MIGPLFVALFQFASAAPAAVPTCSPTTQPGTICVWPKKGLLTATMHTTGVGEPGDLPRRVAVIYEPLAEDRGRVFRYGNLLLEVEIGPACGGKSTLWNVSAGWIDVCGTAAPAFTAHGFTERTTLFSPPEFE